MKTLEAGSNQEQREKVSPFNIETLSSQMMPQIAITEKGGLMVNGEEIDGPDNLESYLVSPDGTKILAASKSYNLTKSKNEERQDCSIVALAGGKYGLAKKFTSYNDRYWDQDRNFEKDGNIYGLSSDDEKGQREIIINESSYRYSKDSIRRDPRAYQSSMVKYEVDGDKEGETRCVFKNLQDQSIAYPDVVVSKEGQQVAVNGIKWSEYLGKVYYNGGYYLNVDPDTKDVSALAEKNRNGLISVIKNGKEWKHGTKNIDLRSQYGYTSIHNEGDLLINDNIWRKPEEARRVDVYDINERGQVAAAVNIFDNGQHSSKVFLGDSQAALKQWDNEFESIKNIAIDDKTDRAAVIATRKGDANSYLVIDDISYALKDDPAKVLKFTMREGEVYLSYQTAIGEFREEKIALKPDAPEVVRRNKETEEEQDSLRELASQLLASKSSAAEALSAIQKNKELEDKIKDLSDSQDLWRDKYYKLQDNLAASQNQEKELAKKNKGLENDLANSRNNLRNLVSELDGIVAKSKKKLTGGYDIDIDKIKNILGRSY